MSDVETQAPTPRPAPRLAKKRAPWIEAMHADWRRRWPTAFTHPVPLAVGFSGQMRAALRDEGTTFDRKMFGTAICAWTEQGAYLRAVMRGEMRRNLDGSDAGFPDEATRMEAKKPPAWKPKRFWMNERRGAWHGRSGTGT